MVNGARWIRWAIVGESSLDFASRPAPLVRAGRLELRQSPYAPVAPNPKVAVHFRFGRGSPGEVRARLVRPRPGHSVTNRVTISLPVTFRAHADQVPGHGQRPASRAEQEFCERHLRIRRSQMEARSAALQIPTGSFVAARL
jgi:hypothetical protein